MKLNVKAFGLACGILWSIGLFLLTWWMILLDVSADALTMAGTLGDFYVGYDVTPAGSVFGLVWGFFDGLIGGAVFAWLYNLLAERFTISPAG